MMTGGVDYVSMGTIYDDAEDEAKQRMEQICVPLEDIPHRSYVRHGQVWNALAAILAEHDIDLIVLGTHGRTGLGKLLLGSVVPAMWSSQFLLYSLECSRSSILDFSRF